MRASEIRQKFLDFFKSKNHIVVASSSLVPHNDPTLLFTNAGMNQFKDVFLGKERRGYTRATSSQKCVRAGGKHNDLENVGFTARHHTFFEMLGNFSFGDYFKADAIKFAWEFVTQVLKLPKDKLYVTVFENDDEAADIWHNQEGVPRDRIYKMGEKDNFWQMGDTGPCGPCSELFIDRGEKYCEKQGKNDPNCKVGCDCDRYMEFWNLVFMQYNRNDKGELLPLPKPSVDTGAGLERIASILQKVDTNYDIDSFIEIIRSTANLCGNKYEPGTKMAPSFRVIADHARAATFLIADGVIPSNEGRGYVLRRIIRRAVRHGQIIGFEKPFLHKVCSFVILQMSDAYPYLKDQGGLIDRCVFAEEEQFLRTLAKGLDLLDAEAVVAKKTGQLSGAVAFKLYDTYGFPLDLTRMILRERGLDVDEVAFERAMADQKTRSREHWKGSGETGVEANYHEVLEALKEAKQLPEFVGYEGLSCKSACTAIVGKDGDIVEAVFAKTPFYGESGGQVGDRGRVTGPGNFSAEVVDVQKPLPDLIVCKLRVHQGELKVGVVYEQTVDKELRALTARNHTATHLLHWALRKVLGTHVKQAGSLVTPEFLRFDFTHFQGVSADELCEIEDLINERIWNAYAVGKREMSKDDAISAGAIAMFGEKYSDIVRVVSVGDFSVELCGGTHVDNSSDINMIKIASEGGIAAGVRRIIAYTSKGAFKLLNERYLESKSVREKLKATSGEDVDAKLERMIATEKELRRTIDGMKSQSLGGEIDELFKSARVLNGAQIIVKLLADAPDGVKTLRDMGERLKQKSPSAVIVLGLEQAKDGKAFILAACGKDIQKKVDANEVIKHVAPLIEGKGGGKAEMAQAGGANIGGLKDALQKASLFIDKQLQ